MCTKSSDNCNIQLFVIPQLFEKVSRGKNDLYQFENN